MNNSIAAGTPRPDQLKTESPVHTVLLVDDQRMVGEAVRRMVANHPDIRFHYCDAAEQAVDTAEQIRPTVILQDLVLPGIDGLTLVAQYRAHPALSDVPIIVFSTKEEPAVKSAAFKMGANDYLVKLPDPIELLARIRYHSKAYIGQLERDRAYDALYENQRQLIAANEKLRELDVIDVLTGLSNRRCLEVRLSNEWKRGMREQTPLSVMLLEINNFAVYVDALGHAAGDDALKKIADVAQKNLRRPADTAARYDADRIAFILPNTAAIGALQVADTVRHAIDRLAMTFAPSLLNAHLTVSVGIASAIPVADHHPDELVEAAGNALSTGMQAGPNCSHIMQPDFGHPEMKHMPPGRGEAGHAHRYDL